jgi:hypothetical protein
MPPNLIGLRSYQDIPSRDWLPHDDYEGKEVRDDSVEEIEREPCEEEGDDR